MLSLAVRNTTPHPNTYAKEDLRVLARRVCAGERITDNVEISLWLCNDDQIRELNLKYRNEDEPTDVLSFPQEEASTSKDETEPRLLGDIVISLDTVLARSPNPKAIRQEVRLLFCHGLLHLLGYDHPDEKQRQVMAMKQAEYLRLPLESVWIQHHGHGADSPRKRGTKKLGRR
ncbi:MAG: rRNA maturation RNase YbeY [Candidatus Hydrogenedentes bacterium]|nr:rRNA maturation RNase YbeY [Candidatus Hydrogenedentota bacterium]